MNKIRNKIIKNPKKRKEIEIALSDILQGIQKEWNLSNEDIADLLHEEILTVKAWTNSKKGKIELNNKIDHNAQAIIDFIEFYNVVSSFIIKKTDQILWLKQPSQIFGNRPPIQMIMEHPHNLHIALTLVKQF